MDVETDDLGLGALGDQAALQEIAEEMVVSVSLLVEPMREQAAILEIGQLAAAVVDAGEPLGDFGRDLLEDRGRQQEVARLLRLLVEHLLCEEVEEGAIGRGGDRRG